MVEIAASRHFPVAIWCPVLSYGTRTSLSHLRRGAPPARDLEPPKREHVSVRGLTRLARPLLRSWSCDFFLLFWPSRSYSHLVARCSLSLLWLVLVAVQPSRSPGSLPAARQSPVTRSLVPRSVHSSTSSGFSSSLQASMQNWATEVPAPAATERTGPCQVRFDRTLPG
jgi:hypothetical protein